MEILTRPCSIPQAAGLKQNMKKWMIPTMMKRLLLTILFQLPLSTVWAKPVETVPQIFVDQKHIGGCTDFEAWAKENLGLFA